MKKAFQKALALSLALMLLLSLATTAAAKETMWISQSYSDIPVIRISGDGEKLVDADGNKVFHYKDIASVLKKDDDDDGDNRILEAIAPLLLRTRRGMLSRTMIWNAASPTFCGM